MDDKTSEKGAVDRLRRREEELLKRIQRLKDSLNQTAEIETLAFKSKLLKEAQDELRRIQDKLAGRSDD